ncbi:MAG: ABC transporter ATP-binding protein [Alphaproteobacteria bacterium]|nr:ABC transporter ATP-binding protein [Alphaproteobacteria bacterium]MBU0798135.1 ABC transporter ATP-binding protein [Alphaproteobacteria bacterium]MBU0887048.1 ABC transporter ATP-binding protein [Alphaproteobacteria bacterium]MBU1814298.1 ABC transporter ATP-binding protein [Alphaproteobacteria bacterium]
MESAGLAKKPQAEGRAASHSLSIRNLSKYYGALAAVDDVSIEVERGKFLTLLGPSGSGKTTILMSIAGFVQPSAGEILLDDRPITNLPPDKRNFGMVFQGYALFPHMSVEDNIWFPLRVRGVSRAEAAKSVTASLELVQMAHLAKRLPTQLSGGQQQRVALARALVFQPDLLLLDEPLSALDKKLRADLQWELKSLHARLGTTFIYVTHDQEEALSMSDDIIILRDGKIEQMGAPGELYERPVTRFVADFLGKSNFIRGQSTGADGNSFRVAVQDIALQQAGRVAANEAVLIALRPEKISVSRTRPSLPNAIEGRIAAFNYYGSSYHLQVETGGLGDLIVTVPAWKCEIDPAIGNSIWLGWEPDASVVVRDN